MCEVYHTTLSNVKTGNGTTPRHTRDKMTGPRGSARMLRVADGVWLRAMGLEMATLKLYTRMVCGAVYVWRTQTGDTDTPANIRHPTVLDGANVPCGAGGTQ